MYTKHRTRLRKLILKHQPVRRREQPEDPELTVVQKQAFVAMMYQRVMLPTIEGKVRLQDVFLPPENWQGSHDEWLAEFSRSSSNSKLSTLI